MHDERPAFVCEDGSGPVVAIALHAGHDVRAEVAELLAIDDAPRRYEEDPFTDSWTALGDTRIVTNRSRFEVDLNRPRDAAVYMEPDDAWGLRVWRTSPPAEIVERSLALHDAFYATAGKVLERVQRETGSFVVFDIHSYNHRRGGHDAPPADPAENPDVNIGTRHLDTDRWQRVLDRLIHDLRGQAVDGRTLDVRTDVRFHGGRLCAWVRETFPTTGCPFAIEVKKIFMDEHTGELDAAVHAAIGDALAATVPGVVDALRSS